MGARTFRFSREQLAKLCQPEAIGNLRELKFSLDEDGELVASGAHMRVLDEILKTHSWDETAQEFKAAPSRADLMAKCKKDHPEMTPAEMKAWVEKKMAGVADAEMALAHSNTIKGVEIFGAGTHNGDEYTEKDLDDMVAAFGKLDVRPALKIGHTKDKVGAPAYGWIENLRRVGTKLVADFSSMHDSVVAALRDRRYDRVSSEIYFNLKRGGQTFRRALKAVALLGAEVPAVAGLTPLHKIEFAEADGFEALAECEQSLNVPTQAMVDALAARVDGLINLVKENGAMKNAEQIKKLKEQLAKFEADLVALKGKGKEADATKVAELEAQAATIASQIKALEQADGDAEENEKLKARVAQLESEGRARVLAEKLASISVPAFRPILKGFIAYALEHAGVKVASYSTDKEGKETKAEVQISDLADRLVGEINAQGAKLFKAYADAGQKPREEGHSEANPGDEVNRRVKEYQAKNKDVEYIDAMAKVLQADPELAKRYETERGSKN